MAIGVDNDGVLYPFFEGMCSFLNKKYCLNIQLHHFTDYDYWRVLPGYQATDSQAREDMKEFTETPEFMNASPIHGSVEGILELKKLDELYIITSRTDKIAHKTREWLEMRYPGCFSKFVFGSNFLNDVMSRTPKSRLCRQENVWLHLDDHLSTCIEVSHDIPVIFFDRPYNQSEGEFSNVTRVGDWRKPGTDWKRAVEVAKDLARYRCINPQCTD